MFLAGIVVGGISTITGAMGAIQSGIHAEGFNINGVADSLDMFANLMEKANAEGDSGIVIAIADKKDAWGDFCAGGCSIDIVSRDTGNGFNYKMPYIVGKLLFRASLK